jgi:Zn-dependent protease with chaperone function
MDFFQHQEAARSKSFRLVVLYLFSVLSIVLFIYFVALVVYGRTTSTPNHAAISGLPLWDPRLFFFTSFGTLTIILLGTAYKISLLRKGGAVIAHDLGGNLVPRNSTDLFEKRLLNVVEEIAIASGLPVPDVFLLDQEDSINAFAAGYTIQDAVIGVTRGALQRLSRDELQGVIAHEFSHILHGDMKLNIRLLGTLHGILLLSILGRVLLESRGSRSSSSKRDSGAGTIAFFGLGLFIAGYVGVFFAKLIKSAVSRQREFLADASAVQFTRNPGGIGGALKKIGGFIEGSKIQHPKAEEASHMYFANGVKQSFARIQRIDPTFVGHYPGEVPVVPPDEVASDFVASQYASHSSTTPHTPTGIESAHVIAQVGTISERPVQFATSFLQSLPPSLQSALRSVPSCKALMNTLLLSPEDGSQPTLQSSLLHELGTYEESLQLEQELTVVAREQWLSLVNLALPTLKRMARKECSSFLKGVSRLANADKKISLFEFSLVILLQSSLERTVLGHSVPSPRVNTLSDVIHSLQVLLSVLHLASDNANTEGFHQALRLLNLKFPILSEKETTLPALYRALKQLQTLRPPLKRTVIAACLECAQHDGRLTQKESELLRCLFEVLECPLPPNFFIAPYE